MALAVVLYGVGPNTRFPAASTTSYCVLFFWQAHGMGGRSGGDAGGVPRPVAAAHTLPGDGHAELTLGMGIRVCTRTVSVLMTQAGIHGLPGPIRIKRLRPLVALAEGKNANGLALVRTGSGSAPKATVRPTELDGMIMTASQLRADGDVRLKSAKTDVTHQIKLTGGMGKYNWAINGKPFDMKDPEANPIVVQGGQRVRLDFVNTTTMWHPMHLHGHTYQLGTTGPRTDTAIVLPKKTVSVYFDADNPGQWTLHCHNAYHGEAGMMAHVAYQA